MFAHILLGIMPSYYLDFRFLRSPLFDFLLFFPCVVVLRRFPSFIVVFHRSSLSFAAVTYDRDSLPTLRQASDKGSSNNANGHEYGNAHIYYGSERHCESDELYGWNVRHGFHFLVQHPRHALLRRLDDYNSRRILRHNRFPVLSGNSQPLLRRAEEPT